MNTNKQQFFRNFLFLGLAMMSLFLSLAAQNVPKNRARILLVPLDDRPPCLQFPVKMGQIGDAEVVAPPPEILGKFTTPGQTDRIAEWIRSQNLKSFDAAIVALDMVAYGGLVASRTNSGTTETEALKRLELIREMRNGAPELPIYAQNVIMRLAPTGTGANESYRQNLADWAELSVLTDDKSKLETKRLESKIPAAALADYKQARHRNLQTNLKAIDFVRNGIINYLILSQDDAKPRGIHVADRERLIGEINRLNLADKIAVQPGADEVGMLLLARIMNKLYGFSPKIKVVYSSNEIADKPMPFEDKPLRETVSYHIKATGSREVANENDADLLFYVYASRFETGRAESFAKEIAEKIKKNKRIIVADIDPKGDVQGGESNFTNELLKRNVFPELNSYASWNTAGNTIGTTLPHGVIFALAENKLLKSKNKDAADRIWTAQNWFTFHRILDDYYYHNPIRAQSKKFIAENNWSAIRLSDEATRKVEDFAFKLLQTDFAELAQNYFGKHGNNLQKNIKCEKPSNLKFDLPWNRTFEAEITFDLQCRVGKN